MTKFQWLNDESQFEQVVYGELDARLSAVVDQIRLVEGGFALLWFLKSNANTLRTVDDIAFRLRQPTATVEKSLRAMSKLNLVRRVQAGGVTWFGMTLDPDRGRLVRDLCAWQDRWRSRLAKIDQAINGGPDLAPDGRVPVISESKRVPR